MADTCVICKRMVAALCVCVCVDMFGQECMYGQMYRQPMFKHRRQNIVIEQTMSLSTWGIQWVQ